MGTEIIDSTGSSTPAIDTSQSGQYLITYIATDLAGNNATAERVVRVAKAISTEHAESFDGARTQQTTTHEDTSTETATSAPATL